MKNLRSNILHLKNYLIAKSWLTIKQWISLLSPIDDRLTAGLQQVHRRVTSMN